MGSGGGGLTAPGPTAEEQQQIALQNQLLQQQLADAAAQRAADAYKQSPEYLNQQLAQTRATQQQQFNQNKSGAYQKARQGILDQFQAFGDTSAAAPYLAALDQQYAQIGYHPGGEYQTVGASAGNPGTKVTAENFDVNRYLQANPDVAAAAAQMGEDPATFATRHFQQFGASEGRTYGDAVAGSAGSVQAPGADTWDDYTTLLNNDYGAGSYITSQRQQRKDAAYGSAQQQANDYLAALGLGDDLTGQLRGLVNNTFQSEYNTAGNSANDYSNVFDPQAVINSATGKLTTAKRGIYTTQANQLFGSVDPNQDFADTADDQYINDLVGTQYGDAAAALERAKARGALTDTGYSSGMNYLGQQKNTALSSAQALGGAVLQRDRDALSGIKSNALSGASGYTLGSSFDPNKYLTDYTTKKGALAGSLQGDVTNALAGQNWFDVGDVLTKAGYAQGAQNTAPLTDGFSTPAAAAIADAQKKKSDASRGLGGVGVF